MKGIKKLLTGILAATMIMGTSLTAFAATETEASITITPKETQGNGEVQEIDYKYYQILHASFDASKSEDASAVTYYLNANESELKDLLVATGKFTATQSADGSRFTMTLSDEAKNITGEAMRDALNTEAIKNAAIKTGEFSYANGSATSGEVEKGYYLVESSLGSVVVLWTLGNENIVEKNEYITTDKTVEKSNYNIGDEVKYKATVYIPATTEVDSEVVLHDTMDSALSFNNNVASEGFTGFTVNQNPTDGCTFEVVIPVTESILDQTLTFTYSATLNQTAAGHNGFINKLFGENNGYKTKPTEPVVYTYDFDLLKTFAGSKGDEGFTAEFEVRTAADNADTAIAFVKNGANYKKAKIKEDGSTKVTVTQGVTSNFYGLAEGTYYLVETATDAQGYNILSEAIAVTITAGENGAYTVTYTVNGQQSNGVVTIENTSGQLLPSTGGIGTTIFYIVGAVLIIAGVAYFIVRRKANAE